MPGQPAGGSGRLAYGYDWVGNRIHPPSSPNPMVYNAVDQLTSWPGMHQYTYYGDGSMHETLNAGGTSTTAHYTYTKAGLLETASYGNSRTLENTWDANANRVRLNVPGHQYDFVYDPTAGIPAVIEEVNAGATSTTTAYYFRDPSGALISRIEGSSMHYYHFDELGSTRLLTDSSGNVTDRYAYDAYGALLAHEGTTEQPYQYIGRLGYYTHYMEPDFGLLQLGARFYESETGKFTQMDPAGYGDNPYSYVDNLPTVLVDPDGAKPISILPVPVNGGNTNVSTPGPNPDSCINKALREADRIHYSGKHDDKLAHCYAACRIMRCMGPLRWLPCTPIAIDIFGRLIETFGSNNDPEDKNAQSIGILISMNSGSCFEGCKTFLDKIRRAKPGRYPID